MNWPNQGIEYVRKAHRIAANPLRFLAAAHASRWAGVTLLLGSRGSKSL